MKAPVFLVILLIFCITAKAQLGIGTTNVNASAQLQVESANKGILIPRIALTGATDVTTIPLPTTSLLIYNTATAGSGSDAVTPAFYYWNGIKWLQINAGPGLPSASAVGQMVYWNGTAWVTVAAGQPGQYLQLSQSGVPNWTGVSFATLSTTTATPSVYYATLQSGGNVNTDGGSTVTARGVCWSTSPSPTISDSKTADGSGIGSYTSALTGLSPATTYYIRAYATNAAGTAYGNQQTYTTVAGVLATLTTTAVTGVTGGVANSGVTVTAEGGSPVTARGVCWSTSVAPTIANSKTSNGTGTGTDTAFINGLSTNTAYHVRAYATNSTGTAYGADLSFTTTSTFSIGGGYQGGIVAYIYQPGDPGYVSGQTHGLIATPFDQAPINTNIPWTYNSSVNGTTATALGAGYNNTTLIWVADISSVTSATLCRNVTLGGYNDWFMPSKDELNKLYLNKILIGGFGPGFYWSSSGVTANAFWGWQQYFPTGTQHSNGFTVSGVRAIRYF